LKHDEFTSARTIKASMKALGLEKKKTENTHKLKKKEFPRLPVDMSLKK